MDELVDKLVSLMHQVPFIEYYSHTQCDMYKIKNIFTDYHSEIIVLSPVSEGYTKAVESAIEWFNKERPDTKYLRGNT